MNWKVGDKTTTRNGREARIICTDRKSDEYPIVVLVDDKDVETYTADGKKLWDEMLDLMPPKRVAGYAVVFESGNVSFHRTEEMAIADMRDGFNRERAIACVKVEYFPGQYAI